MAQHTTMEETATGQASEEGSERRGQAAGQSGAAAVGQVPGQTPTGSGRAGDVAGSYGGRQGSSGSQGASGGQQGRSAGTGLSRRGGYGLSPWGGSVWADDPFTLVRQLADQMDRFFEDFGFGRGGSPSRAAGGSGRGLGQRAWAPQVEVRQRGNDLVVCADLPGLKREDVNVEVRDDVLILQGERRHEHQDEQEGWYRSERSYGSFYRTIPLPEGTDPEQARASFKDGVLEVRVPLPRRESRGRRIEIEGGGAGPQGGGAQGSSAGGAAAGASQSGAQWGGQNVGSAESTATDRSQAGGGSMTGEHGGSGRSEGGI